jgi:hypothetical protein
MEAEIDHGRVIPAEPEKLPATGRAILTVLSAPAKPDIERVKSQLGIFKPRVDVVEWQRKIRSEWDGR